MHQKLNGRRTLMLATKHMHLQIEESLLHELLLS